MGMQHAICAAHEELLTLTSLQCHQEDEGVLQNLNSNKKTEPVKRNLCSFHAESTYHAELTLFKWLLSLTIWFFNFGKEIYKLYVHIEKASHNVFAERWPWDYHFKNSVTLTNTAWIDVLINFISATMCNCEMSYIDEGASCAKSTVILGESESATLTNLVAGHLAFH